MLFGPWTRPAADPIHQRNTLAYKSPAQSRYVGAGGVEPPSSSVSGHARPFVRSVVAPHGTASALFRRVTEPGTAVRREAPYGVAADKLLTAGRELHSM
jgi:hypothetical protein